MLGSDFEKNFIEKQLYGSDGEYLIQLFEPQRKLSSLVNIPDKKFTHDQRVDFALEFLVQNLTILLPDLLWRLMELHIIQISSVELRMNIEID